MAHEGHRERMKNRFIKNGLDSFEPHEALELILYYAIPRRDTNELAHRLIDSFGGFPQVLEADASRLAEVDGIGENAAALLKLVFQSFGYYERQKLRNGFIAISSEAVKAYARSLFVGVTEEKSYLLCFDSKLKLLNCELVAEGTVNAATVSVRRVVEAATKSRAVSVILAHNHPDGAAAPSGDDIMTTKSVANALYPIGIDLSDHIIVGGRDAFSFADGGLMSGIKREVGGV